MCMRISIPSARSELFPAHDLLQHYLTSSDCRIQPTAASMRPAWGGTRTMVARVAVSLLTDQPSRSSRETAVCQSQGLLSLFDASWSRHSTLLSKRHSSSALTVCCLWEQAQHPALEVSFRLCSHCLLPMEAGTGPCLDASCMQLGSQLISTVAPVSCPLSAALMPADGTVENSIVKQSANGGNVDVDNGDATCSAPVTACKPYFLPCACWRHDCGALAELSGTLSPLLS